MAILIFQNPAELFFYSTLPFRELKEIKRINVLLFESQVHKKNILLSVCQIFSFFLVEAAKTTHEILANA